MPITLITGVPGTGKTAFIVSELEKIAATGRIIFVDNIVDLKIEHYRAGKITEWQKGTWLHIDQYKCTAQSLVMGGTNGRSFENCSEQDQEENDGNGNENWIPNPEVVMDKDEVLHRLVFDEHGQVAGSVPYESHKGALLVIDEAQRHFRPRPAGSAVPDHVAALEVHRHQGLDIWLVSQRPGLVDSNVRALCGKHIALRDTPFGRYKYEWPEVGDIESKTSRDTAAKSRYKLPRHIFGLYKSADVHTKHKHSLPMAAKVLMVVLPLGVFLTWSSYKNITGKINPQQVQAEKAVTGKAVQVGVTDQAAHVPDVVQAWRVVGWFFDDYVLMVSLEGEGGQLRYLRNPHNFRIMGRDLSVSLPEGGTATSFSGNFHKQNRGYRK
ncbi:MAG: hypothetical protein A3H31_01615 [Gallionellales bacterium RIFCSPLOWO2_02_FULL_57_47]|nr:MAG: hypothetical protein A3H31_01615 [Gallionellales bacterium RIFCSPLOWO2_02_FULL_57_47]